MLTWFITFIALCTVAGVVLTALGIRGRRLDSNPICRRCGFDLQGRFPWSQPSPPICPDCGEPLLTYRSVIPGARARHTRLLACGLMLCFPAVVLLLIGAADTFAGGATANIKTTSMLASQVSGNTKGSANLRVLTGRVATGSTGLDDIQPAIERALALQANRSIELDPQWLDLLETARRRGKLSPEQLERYFKAAFDWRLLTMPAHSDTHLPFAVQAFADRLAALPTDTPLVVTVTSVQACFDDKPLRFGWTLDPYSTMPRSSPLKPGVLIEVVDTAGHGADIGTGMRLEFSWNVEVCRGTATGPVVTTWLQKLEAKTTVQPPAPRSPASTVKELVALATLSKALAIEAISLERDDSDKCWAIFSLKPSALSHDIVALLRITTADGQIYESLSPVTITPSDPRWPLLTAADPTASPWKVRVQLNGTPGGGKATVELVPYPSPRSYALAPLIWSGEPIKLEGVELRSAAPTKP